MKEFLSCPDAYQLGRDCRAFPPVSLSQYRHHTEPLTSSSHWPASSGSHDNTQARGPWLTPDVLHSPPDSGLSYLYQKRSAVQTDASGRPAGGLYGQRDGRAELNVSMNRATSSDDQPGSITKFVTFSSTSVDVKEHLPLASSSAASAGVSHSQPSDVKVCGPLLTATMEHSNQYESQTSDHHDKDRPVTSSQHQSDFTSSSSSSQLMTRMLTTTSGGPLTSTPVDHQKPATT